MIVLENCFYDVFSYFGSKYMIFLIRFDQPEHKYLHSWRNTHNIKMKCNTKVNLLRNCTQLCFCNLLASHLLTITGNETGLTMKYYSFIFSQNGFPGRENSMVLRYIPDPTERFHEGDFQPAPGWNGTGTGWSFFLKTLESVLLVLILSDIGWLKLKYAERGQKWHKAAHFILWWNEHLNVA